MNRRQYIRVAAGVPVAALTAGCTGGDSPPDQTETIVVSVGSGSSGGALPPATETDAPAIEIDDTQVERVGDNEFVVTGSVRNVGEQPFDHLELDVVLYEESGGEEGFFDEVVQNREFEYLSGTETWTFRLRFEDVEIASVEQYSVTATATLATPTP